MPALAILAVFLMIYVLCQNNSSKGLEFIFIPKAEDLTFNTVLAALGQLFYSMSIGMCILITYGSYMKKDVSIKSSASQIAIFDSAFAFVASIIIVCSVFAFGSGENALKEGGPALMFIQLTNVFNALPAGRIIAVIFFILVLFAAVTSAVSLVEAIVAVLTENGKVTRFRACLIVFSVIILFGTLSSLGFGPLKDVTFFGKGILDSFDFLANNILIPIIIKDNEPVNTLIVSPPGCGKTTLLRDIARVLSIRGIKVAICDERSEIADMYDSIPSFDLGPRTDIIDGCNKRYGISMLIRTMSPHVIITDEIGDRYDVEAIKQCTNAGVKIITSIHGSNKEDLLKSKINQLIFENTLSL